MSQKYSALLMDLDGTLVNTLYSLQDTMNKTMDELGLDRITMEQTSSSSAPWRPRRTVTIEKRRSGRRRTRTGRSISTRRRMR